MTDRSGRMKFTDRSGRMKFVYRPGADVALGFEGGDPELFDADGLHLSKKGYALLARLAFPACRAAMRPGKPAAGPAPAAAPGRHETTEDKGVGGHHAMAGDDTQDKCFSGHHSTAGGVM